MFVRAHAGLQPVVSAAAFICALAATSAHADIKTIASYDFIGGSSASAPGTYGSGITFGSGIVDTAPSMFSAVNNRLEVGTDDTTFTHATTTYSSNNITGAMNAAIAGNQYVSFFLNIPDDATVDLKSLNFDYQMQNINNFGMGVFSSATGFTTGNMLLGIYNNTDLNLNVPYNGQSIDLSTNPAFQDLTSPIEFRFYVADVSSAGRIHIFDNITLTADVLVPEPGSIAIWSLAGAAMAGFGIWRRRRAA